MISMLALPPLLRSRFLADDPPPVVWQPGWVAFAILLGVVLLFILGAAIPRIRRAVATGLARVLRWLLQKCEKTPPAPSRRRRDTSTGDTLTIGGLWMFCIFLGVTLVYLAVTRLVTSPTAVSGGVHTAMLWALGCLVVGSFLGFLFGVPYVVQDPGTAAALANAAKKGGGKPPAVTYRSNTALEQVAEWLTKMVVGVGLVQLTKVPGYLARASEAMSGGYGNATGSHAFGIAVIVYFSFVGFLGAYLMTKLYLQAALLRSDTSTLGGASQQADMTVEEVVALREGTIGIGERERVLTGLAATAAAKLLREVGFDELEDPQDYALWGKASLSAGEYADAIKAYQEACRLAPADVSFKLEHATALYLQERQRRRALDAEADATLVNAVSGAPPATFSPEELLAQRQAAHCVRAQLVEAYRGLYRGISTDLRRNVFKNLTYVYIWPDETPTDYEQAIRYGEEYQLDPSSAPSGGLCVNLACAYGQRAATLDDLLMTNTAALTAVTNKLADQSLPAADKPALVAEQTRLTKEKDRLALQRETTKQRALKQVRAALHIDPTWTSELRRLLYGAEALEDDLKSFAADPLFLQVLGVSILTAPQGVTLTPQGSNRVRAAWQAVDGATGYRPFKQVMGTDAAPVPLPLTSGTETILENVPAAVTLQFYVQATSADGDGPSSDKATL